MATDLDGLAEISGRMPSVLHEAPSRLDRKRLWRARQAIDLEALTEQRAQRQAAQRQAATGSAGSGGAGSGEGSGTGGGGSGGGGAVDVSATAAAATLRWNPLSASTKWRLIFPFNGFH